MGFFSGKKPETITDPYGTWNPMQRVLGQSTSDYLNKLYTQGAPTYKGDYTSPFTAGEQDAIDRQSRLAAMGEGWSGQFQPGQVNPEVDANELRKYNQLFYGNGTDPGAKALAEEQYAGPGGGYWGGARANAVMNAYQNNVTNPYQNFRSTALQNSYQNALNYGQGMNTINQATATMQAVPRLIKQYGLDQQYKEWARAEGVPVAALDQAMKFLDISTITREDIPGEAGNWGMLANIAGLVAAPFTGGASLAIAPLLAGGIDAATSPTGQGGAGSQISGAVNAAAGLSGLGSSWGNLLSKQGKSADLLSKYQQYYPNQPELGSGNYSRIRSVGGY